MSTWRWSPPSSLSKLRGRAPRGRRRLSRGETKGSGLPAGRTRMPPMLMRRKSRRNRRRRRKTRRRPWDPSSKKASQPPRMMMMMRRRRRARSKRDGSESDCATHNNNHFNAHTICMKAPFSYEHGGYRSNRLCHRFRIPQSGSAAPLLFS